MYQRARKLHDLIGDPAELLSLAEEELEAYMVAMNSLALVDRQNAWIVIPATGENTGEVSDSVLFIIGFELSHGFSTSHGNGAD